MEWQELQGICNDLIGKAPKKLINKAHDILVLSRPLVTLKPAQNLARPYICCVVAINEMQDDLGEEPDLSKPPIPTRELKKVLMEFTQKFGTKKEYFPDNEAQTTPRKRRKRVSAAPVYADMDDDGDKEYNFQDDDDDEDLMASPSKRKKNANEIAFKKNLNSMAAKQKQGDGDISKLFIRLHGELDLSMEAFEAMVTTYKRYSDTVTDKWGLAMAISLVVIANSSPEKSIGLEMAILKHSRVKMARERMDQWVPHARRLMSGQRAFTKIAVVLEPLETFRGGSGKWSFPLEAENWWLDTDVKMESH